MVAYCVLPECDRPAERSPYCALHLKRYQRGKRGAELAAPPAEKLSPQERAIEAAIALVEADAEDDAEYESRRRAFLSAARVLGRASASKGGRPKKLTGEAALKALKEANENIAEAARRLGVSRPTMYVALGRRGVKKRVSLHRRPRCPRPRR